MDEEFAYDLINKNLILTTPNTKKQQKIQFGTIKKLPKVNINQLKIILIVILTMLFGL